MQSEQTVCSSLVPRINAEMYVVCIYMATACNDIAQLNDDPSHSLLYVLSCPVPDPSVHLSLLNAIELCPANGYLLDQPERIYVLTLSSPIRLIATGLLHC